MQPNPRQSKLSACQPILAVTGLSVSRSGEKILQNIDWRVNPGEHWAILGANGSGKTSLLSALTGYLTPSAGEIELLGERYGASNWPELRKRIGIVSSAIRQRMADAEPALVSVISGKYATIDHWGRIRREDREEALAILRRLGCRRLAERAWGVLSQGERQRILIGRALMAHPRVLILDEPCAGLDPVARERFLKLISRLTQQRRAPALILVTHHVEEIVEGISHTLLLKAGRVLAAGEHSVTLSKNLLSKTFGARVEVVSRGGRFALQWGSQQLPCL